MYSLLLQSTCLMYVLLKKIKKYLFKCDAPPNFSNPRIHPHQLHWCFQPWLQESRRTLGWLPKEETCITNLVNNNSWSLESLIECEVLTCHDDVHSHGAAAASHQCIWDGVVRTTCNETMQAQETDWRVSIVEEIKRYVNINIYIYLIYIYQSDNWKGA